MGTTDDIFKGMLESMEEKAKANIAVNEGDYILDGLWHCGKCHTPKQCVIQLPFGERKPMALCKCEAEKKKAERAAFEERQRMEEAQRMRRLGFPESDMHQCTFSADDHTNEKISKVALKYVENWPKMRESGKGLLLYGDVGTGKSFYAACIVNALIDRGVPCLMTNFARLVNTISGMFDGKQDYIDKLNRYQLLVLDDLASERDTEYMNEIVQNIIDNRYRAGLPTIITTNLSAQEIKNPADIKKARTYSRLLEMCLPVAVEGKDRRREKMKDTYAEFNDLLGL